MAATIESPAQYDRDLRSANHEWKRGKDSAEKWARGCISSPGVRLNLMMEPTTGSESQQAKVRPRSRYCDYGHQAKKTSQNLVKMRRTWDLPSGRVRTKLHAKLEVDDVASRSLSELPPTSPLLRRSSTSVDGVLYSFDRTDTPGRPLTLDIFVKAPTARDTERLVEKEYEILDTNGEALKGRKARRNLRQTATDIGPSTDHDAVMEVDGFELL